MTQVTVLGGYGYVGSHLVDRIKKLGHQVWVPERNDDSIFSRKLGHLVYAIGLTADFRSRPFDTIDAHICVLNRILRESTFSSLLYLSSTRIYAQCTSTDEDISIPSNPNNPSDLYNISKLMGESITLNSGIPNTRIARLSNVVGGRAPSDSFLSLLIHEATTGEIILKSSLDSEKDYIFIEDAVDMMINIIFNGKRNIYNVASGNQIKNTEWVSALQKIYHCKVTVEDSAPKIVFPRISIDRFIDEFNFRPASAMRWLSK